MKFKVIFRTIRNIFWVRPYFAHLCVTERCNLRCKYCQIWKNPTEELGIDGMKKIVDRLDQMGVAIVSITGGEPLLREDICEIIDYVSSKGLHVRVTSNGMLPIEKYKNLLGSKIDGISISLDGIEGVDTPNSKVNPKILETIKYIYENKKDKKFSISTVLHKGNQTEVRKIVEYVEKNFPGVGVFVQPIVVGTGDLRISSQNKVDPTVLRSIKTLDPEYFIDACETYYRSKRFDWKCKAGKVFFDIKPNGDFHICQDFQTKLNILSKDFMKMWNESNFQKTIDKCSGCTYSCYYLSQESFNPRNWGNMLKMGISYLKK
jgi:MoaA/NifB/PqqE/SkfB family radical SAM enzyme